MSKKKSVKSKINNDNNTQTNEENIATDTSSDNTEEKSVKNNTEESPAPDKISQANNKSDGIISAVSEFAVRNNILTRFIGLFLIVSSVILMINYNKETKIRYNDNGNWQSFCKSVNLFPVMFVIAAAFILLCILKKKVSKLKNINFDSYILVAGMLMFGVSMLWRSDNFYAAIGIIAVTTVLSICLLKPDDFRHISALPKKVYFIALMVIAAGMVTYISYLTICGHRIMYTSTYDMGIFIQMYHSLSTKLSFVTTCERAKFLSHFAVHFSPAYLVLVPFYFIHPQAETLFVSQALCAMGGVVPLWFICKKYNFSNISSFLFGIVYVFSSTLISPCFYDFHENAFLPLFLMWFFYAIEKDKHVMMYIMAVLVLLIKEDAALYIICIGLYLLLSGRKKRHGFILFTSSTAYFLIVTSLMSKYGEGVMTSRTYGNLMTDWEGGFGEVIKTVLTNPAYFISECFKEEKFIFILTMLLPMMFLPFVTKKISRLLLVVPFLLMNLATGYSYAFNIGFQYVFGTTTLLLYVSVLNLSDFDKKNFKTILPVMVLASVFTSVSMDSGKLNNHEIYRDNKEKYQTLAACFDTVPEDASVLATTFCVPQLANRDEIYMLDESNYMEPDTCDFVVLQTEYSSDWMNEKINKLGEEGYVLYCNEISAIEIYISPDYMNKVRSE